MRTASDWTEYEILDASGGEKLERWGEYVLIRPDPQIIWNTPREHPGWSRADAHYFRSNKGGGEWEFRRKLPESWTVSWRELTFRIRPTGFKHTGLFPEQAVNWARCGEWIRAAGRPVRVLNLFAYTGGATLACAAAGASVCHVDASKGMVAWARENAELSGLSGAPVRWIVDDCEKFVQREIKRGRRYDAVIMDPPSYGRGPNGEVWKLEEQVDAMVRTCMQVLSEEPLFFLINSYTTGLSPSVMEYVLGSCMGRGSGGELSSSEIGLPVRSSGMALPCGSTAVWHAPMAGPAAMDTGRREESVR